MIVKIRTYPNIEGDTDGTYERMIECDTVHRVQHEDSLELLLYRGGKMGQNLIFKEKTRVIFIEKGKIIDRIDFKSGD